MSVTVQPPPDISNEQPVEPENPYSDVLSQTFVPMNYQRATEQEVIRQSVEQRQSHQPTQSSPIVMWPQLGDTPINEFHTEGYITCAFPTLFPTGKADFTAPRERQVTIGGQRSEAFSSCVQHFACSLRGTRSYWYRQRS